MGYIEISLEKVLSNLSDGEKSFVKSPFLFTSQNFRFWPILGRGGQKLKNHHLHMLIRVRPSLGYFMQKVCPMHRLATLLRTKTMSRLLI